ncbi:hypothetical protein GCM10007870_27810 [Gluconobacter kondonii]|uniref:Integrase n=2 Tax=Gluconobacter kondonii TaxID=941463 RepID=A0ABQ5WUF9_9PROT|nr:hypothetical protein AA3266_1989 [Gluconobacter kondonii NBRC 3266]GLQ67196.1 hypothetical protein GCM10007870_27810 [Gluconobacter kondonii]
MEIDMSLPAGETRQSHATISLRAAASVPLLRPLHPLLRGHTDRTFTEYLSDRSVAVQGKAREKRVCLIYARERAKDAPNAGIAKAYAQTANEVENELIALLHATRPADPVPFPEPPVVIGPQTLDELLEHSAPQVRGLRIASFLRFCTDLLPGGRDVH